MSKQKFIGKNIPHPILSKSQPAIECVEICFVEHTTFQGYMELWWVNWMRGMCVHACSASFGRQKSRELISVYILLSELVEGADEPVCFFAVHLT